MKVEWQKIYDTETFYKAEILNAVLKENKVDSVIMNKRDSAYPIGHYEIHVSRENVLKAIKILQDDVRFE